MPCDDKGFTLLELILVMLIVSFSLVALVPALEQVIKPGSAWKTVLK